MSDKEKDGFENEEFDSNSDDSFMLENEKDYPGKMPVFGAEQKAKKKRSGLMLFFSVIASIVVLFFVSISAYLLMFHSDDTMKLLGFGGKEEVQINEVIEIVEKLEPIETVLEGEQIAASTVDETSETGDEKIKVVDDTEKLLPLVNDKKAETKSEIKNESMKEYTFNQKKNTKPNKKKKSVKINDKKKTEIAKNDIAEVKQKKSEKSLSVKKTKKVQKKKTKEKVFVQKKKIEPKKTKSVDKVKKVDSKPKKSDLAESLPKKNKTTKYKPTRKNKLSSIGQKKSVTKSGKGLYTIQIYSSPSREDAEEWLDKLEARNIADAFISQQKIRDNIWYRVRFGKFYSREEARTIALKHGFTQTWIDKVR